MSLALLAMPLAQFPLLARLDLQVSIFSFSYVNNYLHYCLAGYTQSYASEPFLYPIMQIPPKKEKHVEFRLVDGVKCKIEVEVEELDQSLSVCPLLSTEPLVHPAESALWLRGVK